MSIFKHGDSINRMVSIIPLLNRNPRNTGELRNIIQNEGMNVEMEIKSLVFVLRRLKMYHKDLINMRSLPNEYENIVRSTKYKKSGSHEKKLLAIIQKSYQTIEPAMLKLKEIMEYAKLR